ncbi:MAG: response regulator, partial [Chloroflexota bacterium]
MTKILIIEDETILREEIIKWLTLEDYETFSAADGIAGVNVALDHQPDLIISDITMPHLDGYGVLAELRANPTTADVPFIFVTARAAYEDVRQGMDLGADDYITKPFSRLELLKTIRTRLDKKAIQEQHREREVGQWQQAFEQEREQRLVKAKLIAMFSHDFRNPLTTIISSNSLLRDYGQRMDSEKQKTHFNRVEGSARQLIQMLDDLLVIAQMETNNLNYEPQQLDI